MTNKVIHDYIKKYLTKYMFIQLTNITKSKYTYIYWYKLNLFIPLVHALTNIKIYIKIVSPDYYRSKWYEWKSESKVPYFIATK